MILVNDQVQGGEKICSAKSAHNSFTVLFKQPVITTDTQKFIWINVSIICRYLRRPPGGWIHCNLWVDQFRKQPVGLYFRMKYGKLNQTVSHNVKMKSEVKNVVTKSGQLAPSGKHTSTN